MRRLADVEELIRRYFDALYDSDSASLGSVMHERAIYATADEQPVLIRDMGEYLPIVAARESPRSRGEPRRDVIETIDFVGANTAFARVRCSIGNRDFVDLLSIIRTEGRWSIIAKVFHFTTRGE